MKNFPVFVFPVSLEFYLNARHTHKQLLTVYNPYDFSVNFKGNISIWYICNISWYSFPYGTIWFGFINNFVMLSLVTVLCTSPNKFTVVDPEGVIAPQNCIDIVVRYSQSSASRGNTTEKFRITMYDRNTQQVNYLS